MNFCKRNFCLIVLLALPVALGAGLEILLEPVVRPARKPTKSATNLLPQTLPHRSVPTTASQVGEEIGLKDNLLTIERLLPFLTESVKSNLHLDGDLRLTPRERWTPFFNKSENLKVEVVDVLPANLGPVSVIQFKVHADNKLIGIWKQAFHAQLFKEILITEEPLARGSFVDVTKFEVRNQDVLQMRQRPVEAGDSLKRHQLRQTLRPGTPLLWRHVSAAPLIRKGETVDVIASQGGLIISLKGQAREDGADGDYISVRNLHSKKDFQAQVIDDKRVRVTF